MIPQRWRRAFKGRKTMDYGNHIRCRCGEVVEGPEGPIVALIDHRTEKHTPIPRLFGLRRRQDGDGAS